MKRQSRTPTTRGWHPKAFTKRARTCLCAYVCTRIYQMNECTVTSSSYECSVNTSKRIPPTPLIINTTWDPKHERADRTIRYRSYYFGVYNITWVGLGLWSTAAVVYTVHTHTHTHTLAPACTSLHSPRRINYADVEWRVRLRTHLLNPMMRTLAGPN